AAAAAILAAALMPGLENPGTLSVLFGVAGTAFFALAATGRFAGNAVQRIGLLADLVIIGPFRLVPDLTRLRRISVRRSARLKGRMPWSVWVVPACFGAVFVTLFAAANPLIENWRSDLDVDKALEAVDLQRLGFWLILASIAWPVIHMRTRPVFSIGLPSESKTEPASSVPGKDPDWVFSPAAILRSLIVFNALFAVQTALDLAYLWGGVELPDGMNYAQYAQRGAYPLVLTVLLAAGFVLAAMRPGSKSEKMPAVRALVYLWSGQNVMLVVSSLLRLNLYVEAYSLTLMRVAAFIWMMLVALGLVLIVARIVLDRSNGWLISRNAGALAITLYACAFVNFPHLVASYNVAHSRELTGTGVHLDSAYLVRLGPEVIQALDAFMARASAGDLRAAPGLPADLNRLARRHRARIADWRGWSLRVERLSRYLDSRSALQAGQEPHRQPYGNWDY
ncbi:MAG TPA: DUF4173 domain-containing protein, partial [Afifellaceae bacterium]|nr:DUF4173 domain-containing protein [Afifellaceae bacterium]